jgi:FixJ family two-component response regulator
MSRATLRVSVVDDELSIRKALERLLTAASFEVRTFGSAKELLTSLDSFKPDCLVVDIHMPDVSGIDLQQHLQRSNRRIPTIMITAFDDAGIRTRCLALGAAAFLTKPLNGPTLIATIAKATSKALDQNRFGN